MIPYGEEANGWQHNIQFHPLGQGRNYVFEGAARILLDMIQPNTHYRFVVKNHWGADVKQLYAKVFTLRWGALAVIGAPRKVQVPADLVKLNAGTDRRWTVPNGGISRVKVYSNKRLVWEGKL